MRFLFATVATIVVLIGSPAAPALAQTQPASPVLYEMGKDASYQQGCFAPCECPVMEIAPVQGTMFLTPLPPDGSPYDRYSVTQVLWLVRSGSSERRLTGSGVLYSGGQFALLRRLALDLSTNGGAIEHFDSGLLPGAVDLSALDFPISLHGFYCFDTGIIVRARPSPRVDVAPSAVRWDPSAQATGYDVVRGDLAALSPGGDFALTIPICLARDLAATGLADAAVPAAGGGFWYLMRSVGGLVGGSYDALEESQTGSRDAGLAGAPGACP